MAREGWREGGRARAKRKEIKEKRTVAVKADEKTDGWIEEERGRLWLGGCRILVIAALV
jgi:hypothetical protein